MREQTYAGKSDTMAVDLRAYFDSSSYGSLHSTRCILIYSMTKEGRCKTQIKAYVIEANARANTFSLPFLQSEYRSTYPHFHGPEEITSLGNDYPKNRGCRGHATSVLCVRLLEKDYAVCNTSNILVESRLRLWQLAETGSVRSFLLHRESRQQS